MKTSNPFKYADDNKRYHTWNYYLRKTFQNKVFKVPLNANFTCPNRDGTKSIGGCIFCSAKGSGDFASSNINLELQFQEGQQMMKRKWPNGLPIAYFQAFTNTYGLVEDLKAIYEPFVLKDDIIAIAIATRPDCLSPDIIEYLSSINQRKELWVELGLQSVNDKVATFLNRQHDLKCFDEAVKMLRAHDIKVVVHIMNSLPFETEEDMLKSASYLASLDIQAIKIHMLHILENTQLAKHHQKEPLTLLSKEEFVEICVKQLELLPPEMIIQRLGGDAPADLLVAPKWTANKTSVYNEIDKYMVLHNTYQGRLYRKEKKDEENIPQ